jgi:HAD superfamily hydrolase (TIGR01549 family)
MDKLKPRAIIFDLGSTLIEYEVIPWDDLGAECAEAGWRFLRKHGYSVPDLDQFNAAYNEVRDKYRREADRTLVEWDVPTASAELFEKLGLGADDRLIDSFFDAYYEPVDKRLFVYDDTLETLEKLKSRYPVMGLVSNTVFPERAHKGELRRFGIAPYLNFTIFSSSFGFRKPHPDIFYHAVNLAGFAPCECVYVGDRYAEDISGPRRIGMEAILRRKSGREYPAEMPDLDRQIGTLSELVDHVVL